MKVRVLIAIVIFYVIGSDITKAIANDNESLITSFIKEFELAMQQGNYGFLDSAIYMDSLVSKVIIKSGDDDIKQFNAGFKFTIENNFKLSVEIENVIGEGGLYNYLSYYAKGNSSYHVIYRLFGRQGLNYHNYEVKIIDNQPRIVDLFLYNTGENISETLKNNYLTILQQKGLINNLDKSQLAELNDFFIIRDVKELYNEGKVSDAYNRLNKTSEQFKNGKQYFLYNSLLLAELDENLYLEFLTDYNKKIQDDPFIYLLSIDFLSHRKEYDQLLSNLYVLDMAVGGDPLLDLYRGNAYLEMKDYNSSLICFTRVKEKFPLYSYGYIGEIYAYIAENDYKISVKLLKDIKDLFDFSTKDIEVLLADYPEFLTSDEFNVWKENY